MIIGLLDIGCDAYISSINEIYNSILAEAKKGIITCPLCGCSVLMHGIYKRKVIFSEFDIRTVTIIQVRCKKCKKVHAIIPKFVAPKKHYNAELIENAVRLREKETCPADDSTIRRWRTTFK